MSRPKGFRADIEGMRAVSVLAVVLWHAGVPWLPGGYVGVDVFFVISGFLMTTILVTELERDGTIRLARFYARRARRLLPAALAALAGTALLTLTLLPVHRWADIGRDIVSSALYVVNWTLASSSVDYLAQDAAPSPLQHFWSLAVEEQFYIVWPVVLLLVPLLFRRRRRGGIVTLTFLAFGASLAFSVYLTAANPSVAYFITPTRIWELALGGMVALGVAEWPALRRPVAVVAGWVGLAMILLAITTYSQSTPFPGWQALLPTVGAALVLIAGPAAGAAGPIRVLRPAPMQFLGGISYSLYLWHWPLLVVAMERFGDGHSLPLAIGLTVAALSVLPAWLSRRYVEDPVRATGITAPRAERTRRSLVLGLNCTLAAFTVGTVVVLAAGPQVPDNDPTWVVPDAVQVQRVPYGAMVLADSQDQASQGGAPTGTTYPPLEALSADRPVFRPDGCHVGFNETEPGLCLAGDPEGETLVVLVGDSHAGMWITALDAIGRDHGWQVAGMTKSSCPFSVDEGLQRAGQPYRACVEWNAGVQQRLGGLDPDLVLVSHARYNVAPEVMAAGLDGAIGQVQDRGIPVAMIRDVPRPEVSMSECLLEHRDAPQECTFPRASGVERSGTGQDLLADQRPELPVIDLADHICPGSTCAPVIGSVPVYRDSNHLSATYVRSLTEELERRVLPLVGTSPGDPEHAEHR